MKTKHKIFTAVVNLFLLADLCGQGIHWSQPSNAQIYLNPAFTGIDSRYSFGLNYRDQWSVINKSYKTYMAAGDYRFDKFMTGNAVVSLGGLVSSDVSADGNYKTNSGGLTLACLLTANPFVKIAAGIGYNFSQSSLSDNFTWGNQFDGQNYNSAYSSGENITKTNTHYSVLNAGISYYYNRNAITMNGNDNMKWIIGYSINQLNRPDIAINGNSDRLNMRHQASIIGLVPLRSNLSLRPTIFAARQGKMNQISFGTLFRYTVGQVSQITGIKKGAFVSVGALYRFKDAIIPTAEFQKSNYIIAMSYDVNVSKFSNGTKFRGGFEICLRIIAPGKYLYIDKEQPKKQNLKKESKPMF